MEWVTESKFTGSKMARKRNLVALSFDDGPHYHNTLKVIKALNNNNAQGTFFWIVQHAVDLRKNDPLVFGKIVSQIKENNHEIGLHAPYDFKPTLSSRVFGHFTKEELEEAKDTLENLTDMDVSLYRPHYVQLGSSIKFARELRMTTVIGDIFNSIKPDNPIPAQVERLGRAKAGSILILHDGQSISHRRNNILDVLPESIKLLSRRGLELTTVSKVLEN